MKLIDWVKTVVILLLTVGVYVPCLQGGFLFDDGIILEECPAIQAPDGLARLWFGAEMPNYEPLTYSVFWAGWQLWADNSFGFHCVNLALHVLAALLLWRLLDRLAVPGAWLAALLFAVHPVAVQSAAYIFQIRNTLSTGLAFAAMACFLRYEVDSRRRWLFVALLFFLLALLSKTSVVMAPMLLLVLAWWQRGRVSRQDVIRLAPFFALALALGLTEMWFQSNRAIGNWVVRDDGPLGRALGAAWAVCFYLRTAAVPYPLMFIHPKWNIDPTSALAYLPMLALAVLAYVLWRKRNAWGRPGLAALGCYVLALLPVLGFVDIAFMRYSLVADHWQYFALPAPIALLVGVGTHLARGSSSWTGWSLKGAVVIVTVGLSLLTWRHAQLFGDPDSLWQENHANNPNSAGVCFSLGAQAGKRQQFEEARVWYEETLRLDPRFVEAHINLGADHLRQGNLEAAHDHLTLALRVEPDSPRIVLNLGGALVRLGRAAEAVPLYECLVEHCPRFRSPARLGLGLAHSQLGNAKQAVEHLTAAVAESPEEPSLQKLLGDALAQLGRFDEASDRYERALAKDPGQAVALVGLGNIAAQRGRFDEAEQRFRQALTIQPNLAAAHGAWGELLARQGKAAQAHPHFVEALRLDPQCVEGHAALGDLAAAQGKAAVAMEHFSKAVQLRPRQGQLRRALGDLLASHGRPAQALEHYRVALELEPSSLALVGRVAWLLATSDQPGVRDGREAVRLAEQLCREVGGKHPIALDTLAAAYAEVGRFAEAIQTARRAADSARASGQDSLARSVADRLALYQRGEAYRDRQ